MSERKFARSLGKPGTAAQLRETVSHVVRESTVQVSYEQNVYHDLTLITYILNRRKPSEIVVTLSCLNCSNLLHNCSIT